MRAHVYPYVKYIIEDTATTLSSILQDLPAARQGDRQQDLSATTIITGSPRQRPPLRTACCPSANSPARVRHTSDRYCGQSSFERSIPDSARGDDPTTRSDSDVALSISHRPLRPVGQTRFHHAAPAHALTSRDVSAPHSPFRSKSSRHNYC